MKIPTSFPVMVTGATGYVGGVLVQQLLEAGLTIHCPVRDPTNEKKIEHLKNLKGGENLKFFKADLLDEGSYAKSMEGCSVVFHVASPFNTSVPPGKEQEMLIDPAVKGTLNVLKSAKETTSVKRVVVTSSVVAIAADGTECEEVIEKTGKLVNEEHWNSVASIDYSPYSYSKTLAEKAAWDYMKENDCAYDLVVCNPGFVLGPGVKIHYGAESYEFIMNAGKGFFSSGAPDFCFVVVDVRDVAKGHIAAGFLPAETVAGQRYILDGSNSGLLEIAALLHEKYPTYPIGTREIPWWLFWLVGPFLGFSRKTVWRGVGHKQEMDNSKSIRDLELEYIPLKDTLVDMFEHCIENEIF